MSTLKGDPVFHPQTVRVEALQRAEPTNQGVSWVAAYGVVSFIFSDKIYRSVERLKAVLDFDVDDKFKADIETWVLATKELIKKKSTYGNLTDVREGVFMDAGEVDVV